MVIFELGSSLIDVGETRPNGGILTQKPGLTTFYHCSDASDSMGHFNF